MSESVENSSTNEGQPSVRKVLFITFLICTILYAGTFRLNEGSYYGVLSSIVIGGMAAFLYAKCWKAYTPFKRICMLLLCALLVSFSAAFVGSFLCFSGGVISGFFDGLIHGA